MAGLKTCYTPRCNGLLLLKFTMDLGWAGTTNLSPSAAPPSPQAYIIGNERLLNKAPVTAVRVASPTSPLLRLLACV